MNHRDIAALMGSIAPVVRDYVAVAVKGFGERLVVLEQREVPKSEKGDPGLDGKDGTPGERGIDGKDGAAGLDGQDGAAGIDGKDGVPGERGIDGKDGVAGLAGEPGRDGQPGVPGQPGRDGDAGKSGLNGKDGLGIEHLDVLYDGERTFAFRWSAGDRVEERAFVIPIVIDRGVWKDGKFKKGDGVTWGGSFFIAQCDTSTKPETSADWRLAIKRGRDGKDGKPGERGISGQPGERGRDLTQMTLAGEKY